MHGEVRRISQGKSWCFRLERPYHSVTRFRRVGEMAVSRRGYRLIEPFDVTTVRCMVLLGVTAIRFKTRISPFAPLLNRLVQLQPVHFFWKADEYPDRQFGHARSFGLIAQEAEKVLPELVTEDSLGYKAVRYSLLPLMTLQAVKNQQDQVSEQREEIEGLKTENANLKARLKRLEQLITGLGAR